MKGPESAADAPDGGDRAQQLSRLAVAIGIGAVVLLLTAGVTTTSFSGQRLAESSSSVHAFDEILRAATLTQAELAIGLTLTDLEQRASIETAGGAAGALEGAGESLRDLTAAVDRIEENDIEMRGIAADALDGYLLLAGSALAAQTDDVGAAELAELDRSFGIAVEALAEERERAAELVRESDRVLGLVSRLVSFLTAFVVPSAGVLVYRLLAVPRRDLLRMEALLARERRMADLRLGLATERLSGTERRLGEAASPETLAAERDLARTRTTLLAIDGRQRSVFEPIAVDSLLAAAHASLGDEGPAIEFQGTAGLVASTDRKAAETLFAMAVGQVARANADAVRFVRSSTEAGIVVELLIPATLRSLSALADVDDRTALEDRLGRLDRLDDVELNVMLLVADGLGVDLRFETRDGDAQVLTVTLPTADFDPSEANANERADQSHMPTLV